jgi:LuxR family maltose regulon positive regulatory protein
MNNLPFLPETYSFQARLALQQGDQAAAQRWAQTTHPARAPELTPNLEAPWLTRTKVLLSQATAASLAEASLILDRLQQVVETQANPFRRIELLALQALVEARQGDTEQALTTLHRSIVLAKPDRFLRTFVDLGPALAGLLAQLVARGVEADYLGQVLAAFPDPLPASQTPPAARLQPAPPAELIEPLTDRELQHLTLLADRLSTKEIAQALTLAPATVRNHLSNLYQKLGVQDRKQAVAQARLLGLLP